MNFNTSVWKSSDPEKRELRVKLSTFERSFKIQKGKNKKLENEVRDWRKKYEELQKKQTELFKKIEKIERQRDKYKSLLFKKNSKQKTATQPLDPEIKRYMILAKTKRGARIGHIGHFREKIDSLNINEIKKVFLTSCPDCNCSLKRGSLTSDHTIEDIPLEKVKVTVTKWQLERQWCTNCKREVKANPKFLVPNSRFGINTLTYILVLRYGIGLTVSKIRKILFDTYKIKISNGGIIKQLQLARNYLKDDYTKILDHVRAAPVKHADETSWRINGINSWVWAFLTKDNIYLTIEESRGKAVPQEKLEGSSITNVLVRDDYAVYKNLNMIHQSCWAHLMKEVRFEVETKNSSKEVRELQIKLKEMFSELKTETELPFDENKRNILYQTLKLDLEEIISHKYISPDARRIQTRIKNQNTNLLTALKYDGVPLTNNLAERSLRQMVITRKLTGGSRSSEGAVIHATNMSVIQTILVQGKELIPTLKEYLYQGSLVKGE